MDEPNVTIEEEQPLMVDLGEADGDAALAEANKREDDRPDEVVADLTKQIEALKHANEQEAMGREQAERIAMEALHAAQTREQQTFNEYQHRLSSEGETIQAALGAAQAEQASATNDLHRAREEGDTTKEADAIARISRAGYQISQYETSAAMLSEQQRQNAIAADQHRHQQRQQQQRPPQRQQRQLSEAELIAMAQASPKLMPQEKEWLDKHSTLITDKTMNKRLESAYDLATNHLGLVRGSPEYFRYLDQTLGLKEEGKQNMGARVSAPVSRGSGGPSNRPQSVKLEERDIDFLDSVKMNTPEGRKAYAVNKFKVQQQNGKQN